MLKQTLSTSLIIINALAGLSVASAAFAATPPGQPCPDGWVRATPPLNPQLGCVPNTIKPKKPIRPNRKIKNPNSSQKVKFPREIPDKFKVNKCELGVVDPIDCPENNPIPAPRD
ncbi:hypothetical protein [Mastigocoleus testarum]|uniref:Uncharacterized protein n=1 Tax=Mastigocoleus testarum BC008 TaxID=371196 RepID=A0A0V7ZS71_9CYAN|nr:hypothetical protein [Mastigocoleus testarum]KST67417.1 hypothetical protein BC008_29940 [Mastigocoleus testarum BC008]